ncbi:MAG: DUF4489 domain-containing protein [Vallitaleaceae bacterium]|nr:DUF4489 domain-containing protein [Vallitaleaceae bacterium]
MMREYVEDYNEEIAEKKCWPEKKDKKGTKVAIACGQVCDDCVNVLECERKHQIASLEIDLKGFKEPVVKLDFSSIVAFRDIDLGFLAGVNAANASFTLKLFRVTNCCQKICIGTFEYGRYYNDLAILEVGLFLAATRDSFSFTKCDHPTCEECVTYLVEVHDTTFDENFITKLVLKQINFVALAVDEC